MATAVRVVFAALVAATFGAFFVAQRLKNSPPVIGEFTRTPYLSPNRDGRNERSTVAFKLKETDDITVSVVDTRGDHVAELVSGHRAAAGSVQRFKWDGRTDGGARAPDGLYRYRVTLQRQGRSVVIQRAVRLDVTPPRPLVTSIGPSRKLGPELLPVPGGGAAAVHLRASGNRLRVLLFKMAPGTPRQVAAVALRSGTTTWRWDGRASDGRRASPGTYLAVAEVRDRAGNIGRSLPLDRRGLPVTSYGQALPGRGGITVRYLGAIQPLTPVAPGELITFLIDSRQERYSWQVRRVGSSNVVAHSGADKTSPKLTFHAPSRAGVYLLELRAGAHRLRVPFVVQGAPRNPVLVVLPTITWLGRSAVDDDGDGLPDQLDRGHAVKLSRMLAGDGLPSGFAQRDAQLLGWLDRSGHDYDVTTDVALAQGKGPRLTDYRGVILPSDARWLPRATMIALRGYVRGGGTIASFGLDALRRQVSIAGAVLDRATPPATTDVFGARLDRVQRLATPATLVTATDRPDVQLFTGTTGAFGGYSLLQTLAPGRGIVASATIQDPPGDRPVIAASRVGQGLVLRYPLPELPEKLAASSSDPQVLGLLARAWTLLSR